MTNEELLKLINDTKIALQLLEQRVKNLEDGSFGTGIYLDGCSESVVEYLNTKTEKAGE